MLAEGEERRDYYGNEENANQASNDRGEQLCFKNIYENFEIFSMDMRQRSARVIFQSRDENENFSDSILHIETRPRISYT